MSNNSEKAFTLLEVLVAMFLFSIMIGGIIPVMAAHANRNTETEVRMGAVAVAQERLDQIRVVEDTETLPTSGSVGPDNVVANGRTYQVTTTYCSNSSYCTTIYNRHILVEVAFRGTNVFSTETVYTRLR